MIFWFYSCFGCYNLKTFKISYVFLSYPENCVIHQFEKIKFEIIFFNSVFILMYGFNLAFCLNLMYLCIFFSINPWLSACFKVLKFTTNPILSYKLATAFSAFSNFVVSGKNGKLLRRWRNFWRHWTSTLRKYPISPSYYRFLLNLH